ncbi:MAG TPA: hypothetical protein VGL22_00020 [Terracidiphilus sp.]
MLLRIIPLVVIAAGVLCTFGAVFLPIAERKAKTRLVGSLGIRIGLCLESMVATVGTNEPEWHRLIILAGWRFGCLRHCLSSAAIRWEGDPIRRPAG